MENNYENEEHDNINKYLNVNEPIDDDVIVDNKKEDLGLKNVKVDELKKEWKDLNIKEELINKLQKVGFKKPSKIQQMVCKSALKNNIISQSQNGSGKTLSFLVPILNDIDNNNKNIDNEIYSPQSIILADTRALITQIKNIINLIDKHILVDIWYSGSIEDRKSPILISTFDQLKKKFASKKISLKNMKRFVIDECDKVLEYDSARNFIPAFILKYLNADTKLLLTSATMPQYIKIIVQKLTNKKNFINIELKREQLTLKNVYQLYINLKGQNEDFKLQCIEKILKYIKADNILIFMNTKKKLNFLLNFLKHKGHKAEKVTSGETDDKKLENEDNEKKIKNFQAGKSRILLTTNLLSRGIDMRKVNLVINAELPLNFEKLRKNKIKEIDYETYLHRVGRTGRFGDFGIALNIILNDEETKFINQIEKFYQNKIKEINLENINNINDNLTEINEFNKDKRNKLEENI